MLVFDRCLPEGEGQGLIWFLWSIWSVWFNQTNQIDKIQEKPSGARFRRLTSSSAHGTGAPLFGQASSRFVHHRKAAIMKNVEMTVEGTMLTIKVDLSKEFGPSASGKTIIIASTEGNVTIPNREEKVGLNVYRKK